MSNERLLFDLALILGDDLAERVVDRLSAMGGGRYIVTRRNERREVSDALEMLCKGMGRAAVRDALMQRYGLSRRSAYRRIESAICANSRRCRHG